MSKRERESRVFKIFKICEYFSITTASVGCGCKWCEQSDQKPNVVFIVVDDLGWDDVGFRSGDIRALHIVGYPIQTHITHTYTTLKHHHRRIRRRRCGVGTVLRSRRVLTKSSNVSDRDVILFIIRLRIGFHPASAYGLPLNETVMAEKFKEAGYATHASGKWHVGFYKRDDTHISRIHDSFLGFYGGGEDYMTHMQAGAYDFSKGFST